MQSALNWDDDLLEPFDHERVHHLLKVAVWEQPFHVVDGDEVVLIEHELRALDRTPPERSQVPELSKSLFPAAHVLLHALLFDPEVELRRDVALPCVP